MSPLGFGLMLAFVGLVSSADFSCNGEADYKYPVEGDCRLYNICSKGSSTPQQGSCSWFFKNFDPISLECTWCWKVDCSAKPSPPPTAPPPTTPTTLAPTTASTAAPSSTTAAPSSSTAAPPQSSTASTATTKKIARGNYSHINSLMINRLKHH